MDHATRLSGGQHAFSEEDPQGVRMDLIKGAGSTSKSNTLSLPYISKQMHSL